MNDAIIFGPKRTTSRRYEHVRRWRATLKRRLVICFGGKCGLCDLVDHDVVYDFHHRDPSKKDFQPTTKIRSWERIAAEMQKCIMVCSHCHRKIHSGLISIQDDVQRFDPSLIDKTEYAHRVGPMIDGCPVCGNPKNAFRKACSLVCAGSLRVTGKHPSDLPATVESIKSRGYSSVAKEIGVSDNTLRKWIRKGGLEVPRFRVRRSMVL